jgi:hypothetical protein
MTALQSSVNTRITIPIQKARMFTVPGEICRKNCPTGKSRGR